MVTPVPRRLVRAGIAGLLGLSACGERPAARAGRQEQQGHLGRALGLRAARRSGRPLRALSPGRRHRPGLDPPDPRLAPARGLHVGSRAGERGRCRAVRLAARGRGCSCPAPGEPGDAHRRRRERHAQRPAPLLPPGASLRSDAGRARGPGAARRSHGPRGLGRDLGGVRHHALRHRLHARRGGAGAPAPSGRRALDRRGAGRVHAGQAARDGQSTTGSPRRPTSRSSRCVRACTRVSTPPTGPAATCRRARS